MSCFACMYSIGKAGTCNMTYACNTTGERPKAVIDEKTKQRTLKEVYLTDRKRGPEKPLSGIKKPASGFSVT